MGYKLAAEELKQLHAAMVAPDRAVASPAADRLMRQIAIEGWAQTWIVEDLVMMTDRRFEGPHGRVDLRRVSRALGLPLQSVCLRPGARSNCVSLSEAWSALDAAGLFVALEMLGFAIDPSPLVAALAPTLPKKGYVSGSALDVLWYTRRRGKSRITFQREDASGPLRGHEDHLLRGGYRLTTLVGLDGEPVSLTVTGPRYRRQADPVETRCPRCGLTWWRGDPDSSASHRREHRKRMAILDPEPHERVREEAAGSAFDEHVDQWSPEWRHREMYRRAVAFRREEGYDFVQWSVPETDPDTHGFLFADEEGRIVGACAFRMRDFEAGFRRWCLQWIWVAPEHRRRGVLRSRWEGLRQRFGDFWVEPPVSDAMRAFLGSMGDKRLLDFPEVA